MDSYFLHLDLAEELRKRDTFVCGTMKGNMLEGMPLVLTDKKCEFAKNLDRGDMAFLHTGNMFRLLTHL